jgi:hypothetical protein
MEVGPQSDCSVAQQVASDLARGVWSGLRYRLGWRQHDHVQLLSRWTGLQSVLPTGDLCVCQRRQSAGLVQVRIYVEAARLPNPPLCPNCRRLQPRPLAKRPSPSHPGSRLQRRPALQIKSVLRARSSGGASPGQRAAKPGLFQLCVGRVASGRGQGGSAGQSDTGPPNRRERDARLILGKITLLLDVSQHTVSDYC